MTAQPTLARTIMRSVALLYVMAIAIAPLTGFQGLFPALVKKRVFHDLCGEEHIPFNRTPAPQTPAPVPTPQPVPTPTPIPPAPVPTATPIPTTPQTPAPQGPTPSPAPPGSCSVTTPNGVRDLSLVPPATLRIAQVFMGKRTEFEWTISLCSLVNQPPPATTSCAFPGFISQYGSGECVSLWADQETGWSYNAALGTASAVFVEQTNRYRATIMLACGSFLDLQSVDDITVSPSIHYTILLKTSAMCADPPPTGPSTPIPAVPTPQPNSPTPQPLVPTTVPASPITSIPTSAPVTPAPIPSIAPGCQFKTTSGLDVDLEKIGTRVLNISEASEDGPVPYSWTINLCDAVNAPPSQTMPAPCSEAGYVSQYSDTSCQAVWTHVVSPWSLNNQIAIATFANSAGDKLTIEVRCALGKLLVSTGVTEVTNGTATMRLGADAICTLDHDAMPIDAIVVGGSRIADLVEATDTPAPSAPATGEEDGSCHAQHSAIAEIGNLCLAIQNGTCFLNGLFIDVFGGWLVGVISMVLWTLLTCISGIDPESGIYWSVGAIGSQWAAGSAYLSMISHFVIETFPNPQTLSIVMTVISGIWDAASSLSVVIGMLLATKNTKLWGMYMLYGLVVGVPSFMGFAMLWSRKQEPASDPMSRERKYDALDSALNGETLMMASAGPVTMKSKLVDMCGRCKRLIVRPLFWVIVFKATCAVAIGYVYLDNVRPIIDYVHGGHATTSCVDEVITNVTYLQGGCAVFSIVLAGISKWLGPKKCVMVVSVASAALVIGAIFVLTSVKPKAGECAPFGVYLGFIFILLWRLFAFSMTNVMIPVILLPHDPASTGVTFGFNYGLAGGLSAAIGGGLTPVLHANPKGAVAPFIIGTCVTAAVAEILSMIATLYESRKEEELIASEVASMADFESRLIHSPGESPREGNQ